MTEIINHFSKLRNRNYTTRTITINGSKQHCIECLKSCSARLLDCSNKYHQEFYERHSSNPYGKIGRTIGFIPSNKGTGWTIQVGVWNEKGVHSVCKTCGKTTDTKPINCSSSEHKIHYDNRLLKAHRRHREMPTWIILNEKFEGSHLHHFSKYMAGYIPEKLHRQFAGKHSVTNWYGMNEVNDAALDFILQHDFGLVN